MRTNQLMGLLPYMAVFVKVVELGSFSAAAEQLGSSASSVSRQIASLEAALGVRLLERTTRRLRLTEAGSAAWARCDEMLRSARSVVTLSEQAGDTPQGCVRLSVPRAIGNQLIAPAVPEFLRRFPQVDLQLMMTDRPLDLIAGEIDLAIRITDQPPPGLAGRPLRHISHVLCASPGYLHQRGTPQHPRDLPQHDCIWLAERPGDNSWRLRHGETQEEQAVTVRGRYATNHSRARLEGVIAGLGIGCIQRFTAAQALAEGQVVAVLPEWEYMTSYYGTAWLLWQPNHFLPPKCRALIDFLLEKLADTPQQD